MMTTIEMVDVNLDRLPSLAVPAGAVIATQETWNEPVITNAYKTIASLIRDQEVWLNGVHRTANEQLYLLLQRCYHLYKVMSADAAFNKQLKAAIEKHNTERNLGINMESHTMTNIVKVVFGADRRRSSAYSTALRIADAEKVNVMDLPQFLRDSGGVEEVRRKQASEGATALDKVAVAKKYIAAETLAVIDEEAIASKLDCGKLGEQVILVATQDVNGKLNVNALVQGENVTKAVLTAIYNSNHKKWSRGQSSAKAASEEDELEQLINAAAS